MPKWSFDTTASYSGRFQIVVTKPGHPATDVTFFRGAPTQLESYSNADPFGDAAAVFSFPAITGYDDLDSIDVGSWLADYANVDIFWLEAFPVTDPTKANTIDPLTGLKTLSVNTALNYLGFLELPDASDPNWVTPGTMAYTASNPPNTKAGYPTGWTDSAAMWLWPNPPGPTVSDEPNTRAVFLTTFTLASAGTVNLEAAGDNVLTLKIDDIVLVDAHRDWRTRATASISLAAGDHIIEAVVINDYQNATRETNFSRTSNPGGYLFSLRNSSGTVIVRSDASTKTQRWKPQGVKVWEGYIASMEISSDENSSSLQVQCQGALFQLDRYLQKPFYPPRPWPLEKLISDAFSLLNKPNLRSQPLVIEWPTGWTKVAPSFDPNGNNVYLPVATPGDKYSGYSSRATGSWDHALTGFIQDLLAVMYTDDDCGVTPGNQWTVRQDPGRQPVLMIRDRFKTPDFEVWLGTPGVTFSLTRDTTQSANIIYGEGTGTDGTTWRNASISSDGSRTDYLPLAASPVVWPTMDNTTYDRTTFMSEAYYSYGSGFPLEQAINSAKKSLVRDEDPGWSGEMTLKVDPPGINRYLLRAGATVKVKGIVGSGAAGLNFHIAEVSVDAANATVTCKVDTRYRDLLNLEEARARTRDPLTPSKMLQVNRRSVMIEDVMAPWDYTAGSGFIPRKSTSFHANRPVSQPFPWTDWCKKYPPRYHPEWYVPVRAYRPNSKDRWNTDVPILTSERGTIRRIEIACVDLYGNALKIPFHFSLYKFFVPVDAMPYSGSNYSPFQDGAFERLSPTGQPWPLGSALAPPASMIIGWGNKDQPAGYSPGTKTGGFSPTGLLVDEGTFTFDNTENDAFQLMAKPGQTQSASAITLYGAFYAEANQTAFFIGRMYRAEPGT